MFSFRCSPQAAKPARFTIGSIEHQSQPEGGRDLREYERVLGFSMHALDNKRVLDLGSGPQAKFAAQLAVEGVIATVVSLSPDYAINKYAKMVRAAHPSGIFAVGLAQELPFAAHSFDAVVAFHVGEHLSAENFVATAEEVGRVLAPGGWARLGPLAGLHDNDPHTALIQSGIRDKMAEDGVMVLQEFIPLDTLPHVRLQDRLSLSYDVQGYNLVFERTESQNN